MKVIVLTSDNRAYRCNLCDLQNLDISNVSHTSLYGLDPVYKLGIFHLNDSNRNNKHASSICRLLSFPDHFYDSFSFKGTALVYDDGKDMNKVKWNFIREKLSILKQSIKTYPIISQTLNNINIRSQLTCQPLLFSPLPVRSTVLNLYPQNDIIDSIYQKFVDIYVCLSNLLYELNYFQTYNSDWKIKLEQAVDSHTQDIISNNKNLIKLFGCELAESIIKTYHIIIIKDNEIFNYIYYKFRNHNIRDFLGSIDIHIRRACDPTCFLYNILHNIHEFGFNI